MRVDGLDDRKIYELERYLEVAFNETMIELDKAFTKSIIDSKWGWPRGISPRDIVDTGALERSQNLDNTSKRFVVSFSWQTDYAPQVHEGTVTKTGLVLPPRRWTEDAMNVFNIRTYFAEMFQRFTGLRSM